MGEGADSIQSDWQGPSQILQWGCDGTYWALQPLQLEGRVYAAWCPDMGKGSFVAKTKSVMCLCRVSCLGGGVQPKHRGSGVRQVSPGEYYNAGRRAPLPPSQASMASSERVRIHAPVVRGLMLCACLRALWQCPRAVCGKLQLRQLAAPRDCKDAGPWAALTTSQAFLP